MIKFAEASSPDQVALLAEGVDRNSCDGANAALVSPSPSSRRAWIEIGCGCAALRDVESPSSRRAWIEILRTPQQLPHNRSPSSRRAWIEMS